MESLSRRFGTLSVTGFVTGKWKENCYLVSESKSGEAWLIDPGDEAGRLLRAIRRSGLRLSRILCTHAHYDHIGAAEAISSETNIACTVHEKDLKLLRRAPLYALSFEKRRLTSPSRVLTFGDDTRFKLGAFTFEVLPTPGHTPGGVCLWSGPLLFSGDTLLHGALGRTDLPGGEAQDLRHSLERLFAVVQGPVTVMPGHGRSWTMDEARRWWLDRPGSSRLR